LKPEIIIQDGAGVHAADLSKTEARLVRSGSWKKKRMVVVIPAGDSIYPRVYLSHCGLIFPPNQAVQRVLAQGMEVGAAYSATIDFILRSPAKDWEYVLFLEHDNMPPADGVLRLLEHIEANKKFSAIGGLYFTKGPGGVAQIWGDPRGPLNFRPQPPDKSGGLVECCGTGMGFTLFRLSLFKDKRIKRPWFRTLASKEGVGTQDLSFWAEARKYGHRCAIACDVRVGHYDHEGKFGPAGMVW
jgi:hypothetical protein